MLDDRGQCAAPSLDRALAYRWLSGLFAREISPESLRAAGSVEGTALMLRLDAVPGLATVVERYSALSVEPDATARELAGAFAFLFLGVGGRRGAPPYERAYSDEPGAETLGRMRQRLRALDLHVASAFPEPEDHIAVQLAAMAELIARDGSAAGRAAQADFLRDGLARWIDAFADACAQGDRRGFYAAVARAAADLVASDLAALGAPE